MKNTVVFTIGNFSSKILVFLLLPLYTNYLNPAEYGEVDIYINILSIAYSFVSLQTIETVFRYIQDAKNDREKDEVISNSLIVALAGIAVFAIGMTIYGTIVDFPYTFVFILYVAFNILAQYCQQAIRGMNSTVLYSTVGVLSTFVQLASNIIFIVICHFGAVSLLWSHVVTSLFILLAILLKCNILKHFKFSAIKFSVIKEQLGYSIPLMPNAICIWGINSLGRYLLLFFYTTTEVGLLSFATKFSQALGMVNNIFFMAWQQSAISEYNSKDKNEYATEVFNNFLSLLLSAAAILMPAIKFLTFTIMGDEYRIAWVYVPIFFLGTIFNACERFVSMGFYSAKKTSTVFITSLIALAIYFGVGYFAAKEWYIWGVGIAHALSEFVYYLIMHFKVKKYMHVSVKVKKLILPVLIVVVSTVLYYLVDSIYMLILVAAAVAFASLFANMSLFKGLIRMLLGKFKKKPANDSK